MITLPVCLKELLTEFILWMQGPVYFCYFPVCIFFSMYLETILRTALSLYMEDEDLPLPTYEEVLVCYPSTTAEEVGQKRVLLPSIKIGMGVVSLQDRNDSWHNVSTEL